MRIDLILAGEADFPGDAWSLGEVVRFQPNAAALAALVEARLPASSAEAWLFWDLSLGAPSAESIAQIARGPGQVWHAGLALGTAGLPESLDFVSPTWMLNADADPAIESTSWRMDWRACLLRTEVLRKCGGPRGEFETLTGSALEMGHRLCKAGVVLRHVPDLVPTAGARHRLSLSLEDEVRFLHCRFNRFWFRYATGRMACSGFANPLRVATIVRRVQREAPHAVLPPFPHQVERQVPKPSSVTVLIPTIDRYPYLQTVLSQLGQQTVPPTEIVVIDQTHPARRNVAIPESISGIPIHLLYLDKAGQCSARNAGLRVARGEYILFIDDDDEVEADLIARHLSALKEFDADVSAGVADEAGAGPLPPEFRFTRLSDVFPTNNCMIRTTVLDASGMFDLAYDRGSRADGDLGMRAYLSGALMMLNPGISVFHHHAPMGGLRTHKARKITYASSRTSVLQRHLPGATEAYLWKRYFTPRQVREEAWLRALGTLVVRGGLVRKSAKFLVGVFLLPHTWWRIGQSLKRATQMLARHPQIPSRMEGRERAVYPAGKA